MKNLPRSLLDGVDIWPMCLPYWKAFALLTQSRPLVVSMAGSYPLPIPYSEKSAYARDHGFAESYADLDEFVFLIGEMDKAYLDHTLPATTPK